MNLIVSNGVGLLTVMAVLPLVIGCIRASGVGDLQTESRSVKLGDAESVRVRSNAVH